MEYGQMLMEGVHPAAVSADLPLARAEPPTSGSLAQAVDGLCVFDSLALQLQIHANDTLERKTLARRFDTPPQLTIMLLLEGEIGVSINQTRCRMSARQGPVGYLWLLSRPGTLIRHTHAGHRVRKVNVTLSLEGVESLQLQPALRASIDLDQPRTSVAQWVPNPHAIRCAQEILGHQRQQGSLRSLDAFISGLSLFQQALKTTVQQSSIETSAGPAPLKDRDMMRARKIRELILSHAPHETACPQQLAQALGMSVSTLQRLFKAAYGSSVMEFQRSERLKAARSQLLNGGLTVGEVSYRAGYSTASNFSSAFQRAFGYPPSACTRR
jgi:AraC-like DNA-binding protein